MVKVYSVESAHWNLTDSDELVLKSDFDRAISLLKAANEAMKESVSAVAAISGGDAADDIQKAIKETEEFLEECK